MPIFDNARLITQPVKFLVPGLCLGTDCSRGSASLRNASETRMLDESAGRACKSVGSKAEPWNQWVAIGEKCPIVRRTDLDTDSFERVTLFCPQRLPHTLDPQLQRIPDLDSQRHLESRKIAPN